jgi:cysteine desulfurase family protein (TIGR01976 family)
MGRGLDLEFVRLRFPALAGDWTYLDNAGGSQCLHAVAQRAAEYLSSSMVATGGPYGPSLLAGERQRAARARLALLLGAERPEEIVLGSSSTQLMQNLGHSLAGWLRAGDEIVLSRAEHHANVEPWLRLGKLGIGVREWPIDVASWTLRYADLEPLLTPRTRIVAFTHCSNIVGSVHAVQELTRCLHERGILVLVDGVAYAPHAAIDVRGLGVDFYLISLYKVFGPHLAVLWGRRELLLELPGINHSFLAADDLPYKFQPGNANPELSHGATAIVDYLVELGRHEGASAGASERRCIEHAFAAIGEHEAGLTTSLLEGLSRLPSPPRLLGRPELGAHERCGIVSLVPSRRPAAEVAAQLAERRLGVRAGDFYAKALAQDLGFTSALRISLAHYNSQEEVDRLLQGLRETL